jgi:4'-phosphopantetheinyl transferase
MPPGALELSRERVLVWSVDLDAPADAAGLARVLDDEERERAARFYLEEHRRRFTAAHAALRVILGLHLGVEPREIRFATNQWGKPCLARGCAGTDARFNISHSNGLALVAVALAREVGVDVEFTRPGLPCAEIAGRFFSRAEADAILRLPPGEQAGAFYRCWTRKEAFIKAAGGGLSIPLDGFDVSIEPGAQSALRETRFEPDAVKRWVVRDLEAGPDCAAALAVEGGDCDVHCTQVSASALVCVKDFHPTA